MNFGTGYFRTLLPNRELTLSTVTYLYLHLKVLDSLDSAFPLCTGAVALTSGFTNGAGSIWLSEVRCAGTETTLTSCTHAGFGVHTCSHTQDAGVSCTPCSPQGGIRLRGSFDSTGRSGRVEICNNVWGTVCDDFWGTTDAQVACRQLGFETIGKSMTC